MGAGKILQLAFRLVRQTMPSCSNVNVMLRRPIAPRLLRRIRYECISQARGQIGERGSTSAPYHEGRGDSSPAARPECRELLVEHRVTPGGYDDPAGEGGVGLCSVPTISKSTRPGLVRRL